MPLPIRKTPTRRSSVPVISLGKILLSVFGGTKLIRIWTQTVHSMVPKTEPQASGHGPCVPSAAVGHFPDLYCSEAYEKTMGRISKVGPTTESKPVPMKNGDLRMCSLVTWNAVATPVVMKAVLTRYSVIVDSKLNAPPAMASGGETMEPIMVKACWSPRMSVNKIGTRSLSP